MTELALFLDKNTSSLYFEEPGSQRDRIANVAYVLRDGEKLEVRPQKGIVHPVPVRASDKVVKVYVSNRGNTYVHVYKVVEAPGWGLTLKPICSHVNPPLSVLRELGLSEVDIP